MRLSESTWRNSKPMARKSPTDIFATTLFDTETEGLFDREKFLRITKQTVPDRVNAFLLRAPKSYPKHQQRLIRRLQDATSRKYRCARFAAMTAPIIRCVMMPAAATNEFIVTVPIPDAYWFNSAFDLTSLLESPGTFQ